MTGEGKSMGEEAADWFSRYLGQRCALYCCTGLRHCATDSKWGDLVQAHDKVLLAGFMCCSAPIVFF